MINVEQVNVNMRMPSDRVAVVALQPYVELDLQNVPYKWLAGKVEQQLASISRTLDLAEEGLGDRDTTVTLFPEYSIPGVRGANIIHERLALETWPNDTVVVGGVHALTLAAYTELCEALDAVVADGNSPAVVPDNRWVNCCITWIKDQQGDLRAWIQPKVRSAWLGVCRIFVVSSYYC